MFKLVLLVSFCLLLANAKPPVVFTRGGRTVEALPLKELVLPSLSAAVVRPDSSFKSPTELVGTCDGRQLRKYLGHIVSDTVEVVKHVGWNIGELLWGTFVVCLDPYLVAWCVQLDYPKAMLIVLADIPVSLVEYLINVLVLLGHVVACIL